MSQSTLHLAIIMDGNGRWAARRGLPRIEGHRAGAEALRRTVEAAPAQGVSVLTVYAFSSGNWQRPADEVDHLMLLLGCYLESETPRCLANGIRISVIGRRDRLSPNLTNAIEIAERQTAHCRIMRLRLAIDYSARDAILRASRSIPADRASFEACLTDAPPVDLLVRTGGEQRLSDFLLWESAYAELIFSPRMWPDFNKADLRHAIANFQRRHRRFGALPVPPATKLEHRWLR